MKTVVELDYPQDKYEVLIIDNNSTDDTKGVCEEFSKRYENVHYFFETKQGLSHARNRGAEEAGGRYLAYLDDECKVGVNWLRQAESVINESKPLVFGGPYEPWYLGRKPIWFKDTYASSVNRNVRACNLSTGSFLDGANIFIERDTLLQIGGFDTQLGMRGGQLAYGEETAFQVAFRRRYPDEEIRYDPALSVKHLVRREKMSVFWSLKDHFIRGAYSDKLFSEQQHFVDSKLYLLGVIFCSYVTQLFLLILQASIGIVFRSRVSHPYPENYAYEVISLRMQLLGKLSNQLGQLLKSRGSI